MQSMLKVLGYYTIFIIFITFLFSLFNILGIDATITNLLLFIFNTIAFFIFGFKSGKLANNKGYLKGLKISSIFLLLLIIINIIIKDFSFNLLTILYYIILITSCIIGAMIGINKKKETN